MPMLEKANNTKVKSVSTGKTFRFMDDVNFKYSSSYDPTTVSIFETDSNVPTKYSVLLKYIKSVYNKYSVFHNMCSFNNEMSLS